MEKLDQDTLQNVIHQLKKSYEKDMAGLRASFMKEHARRMAAEREMRRLCDLLEQYETQCTCGCTSDDDDEDLPEMVDDEVIMEMLNATYKKQGV